MQSFFLFRFVEVQHGNLRYITIIKCGLNTVESSTVEIHSKHIIYLTNSR